MLLYLSVHPPYLGFIFVIENWKKWSIVLIWILTFLELQIKCTHVLSKIPLPCQSPYDVSSPGQVYVRHSNLDITLSGDGMASTNARPSADTMLI